MTGATSLRLAPSLRPLALIKGAGDLATGVALRLRSAGFSIVMTEISSPTVVRRSVAFAEAVYEGEVTVEGVRGVCADDRTAVRGLISQEVVTVVVDPETTVLRELKPVLLVDAIIAKRNLGTSVADAPAVVALGPGFLVGRDAHAVVETCRGHTLGRVITEGEALPDTGIPGEIGGRSAERVLRAPGDGMLRTEVTIGTQVRANEVVAHVGDLAVVAPFDGVMRGLLRSGLHVTKGMKLGDVDPRASCDNWALVSDKALAVAGGVLEAACALLGGVRFG
jgi:xanthine dehydrogenase accessory factor